MARKGDRELLENERGPTEEPPCIAAGDDRAGPEHPPWVVPVAAGVSGKWSAARDPELKRDFPLLHDFLVLTGYGGKARRSGSVGVFAEDGKWKARVQDRENGFVAFLSAETFRGLLEAIEKGLKGSMDWREDKYAKKR